MTREEAAVIAAAMFKLLGYLYRLKARMERARFPANDPLYAKVVVAYEAAHLLDANIHSISQTLVSRRSPSK